ncbi:MAG: hypothetical protein ACI88A_000948 [Paraglaciecola sp.]|jgi:hypothetical protein
MYLIKNQNYSFSGATARCNQDGTLLLNFAARYRAYKFKSMAVELRIDVDLILSVVEQDNNQHAIFNIDIPLSAFIRYSAYCPEAKPRLIALWNKHIGNYEEYKVIGMDQLGYLLCVIAHPEIGDFTQEPFTLMLLCEAIITPTRACNIQNMVTLKRPEILKSCLVCWFKAAHPQFDETNFPEKFTNSVYRFCQRLVLHIISDSEPQQVANAKAMEALLRIASEPQLINRLQHMNTIYATNLASLELFARLPYSRWLQLQEAEAATFCDYDTFSYLVDDIDGMTKEIGLSLKKCLLEVKTIDDLQQLHDRLVIQLNARHRKAQLADPDHVFSDPFGEKQFPPCRLLLPKGIKLLNTANSLRKEGLEMNHCVGGLNYSKRARLGLLHMFHVEHKDHHATLEIDARELTVQQIQSVNNAAPHPDIMKFVLAWLDHEKKRLALYC